VTISERDKKIVTVLIPLVIVLAYWFLLMAPKREAASAAAETLETEQATLADARIQATTVQAAKANFARDYAAVVALGKAIPTSVDMPSLLVQLEQAAKGTGIKLEGVTMGERTASEPAPAPTAAAPGAPDPAQSAPGQAATAAENAAATAEGASTPPPDPADGTPPDPAASAATGTTAPAPASGGLESVALEFDFNGNFFELADFFHRLKRFVYVEGEKVRVRGRLMTIDAVEYSADAENFPALTATVSASVYLTPKAEGTTAGATPTGPPAGAAPAPVATAESDPSSPTPTATATP